MPPSSGFLPRPLTGSSSGWFFSSQALYTAPKRSASKRERLTLGSRAAIPSGTSQAGASPWPESAAAWLITAAYWRAVTSYLPMKYSIGFSGCRRQASAGWRRASAARPVPGRRG